MKQEDKAHAQEKFVEIQQAYEKLSDIKSRRARANKISEKMPADTEQKKTELWYYSTYLWYQKKEVQMAFCCRVSPAKNEAVFFVFRSFV